MEKTGRVPSLILITDPTLWKSMLAATPSKCLHASHLILQKRQASGSAASCLRRATSSMMWKWRANMSSSWQSSHRSLLSSAPGNRARFEVFSRLPRNFSTKPLSIENFQAGGAGGGGGAARGGARGGGQN